MCERREMPTHESEEGKTGLVLPADLKYVITQNGESWLSMSEVGRRSLARVLQNAQNNNFAT